MPVYTKYLSPVDYGTLNTLTAFGASLPVIMSLSLDASFARYYFYEKKISHKNVRLLYSTHFWFIVFWGLCFTAISLLLAPSFFKRIVDIPYWPYLPLTIVPVYLSQLNILGIIYIQSNLWTMLYASINLLTFILSTTVVLVLLIPYKMGILANLYGTLVGTIITIILFIIIAVKNSIISLNFNLQVLKRSLVYSIPLIPGLASGWITSLSDRLILAYYGRLKEVGLYSISALIAQLLYYANDAITQVQGPIGMSALTENMEKGKQQISEFISVFIWGITFLFLALTFFSKELLYLFADHRYHMAYKLVGILAFCSLLGGFYRPFTIVISYHAKTWILAVASILSATINAILNFMFIPYFGQYAAAWSTLISVFAYTVWIVLWAQKINKIPVNWKLIGMTMCLMIGFIAVQQAIEYLLTSMLTIFLLKLLLLFTFFTIDVPENINRKFAALIRKPLTNIKIRFTAT